MSAALGGRGHECHFAARDASFPHELAAASSETPRNTQAVPVRMLLQVPASASDTPVLIYRSRGAFRNAGPGAWRVAYRRWRNALSISGAATAIGTPMNQEPRN